MKTSMSNTQRRKRAHPKFPYWPDRYKPLKITAHIAHGVIGDGYFPLDGILMAARIQDMVDVGHNKAFPRLERDAEPIYMSLPLERRGVPSFERAPRASEDYYWAASWAIANWYEEEVDHYSKRTKTEFEDMLEKPRKLHTGSGRFREYRMPLYYLLTDKITWYAVGDPYEVEYLLSTWVLSIGRKRSQGWGRVLKWEIEEIEEDYSEIKDGNITRGLLTLPESIQPDKIERKMYGLRAPYWNPSTWRMLYVPKVKIGG